MGAENDPHYELFDLFNEIGIIQQLSSAILTRLLPAGLHVSHFSVINHLVRLGDGRTPLRIAKAFQVTKATMTHTLNVLKRHGFIDIRPNPEDGRSKLVYLTDEGRNFRNAAIAGIIPALVELNGKLDLEKMPQLLVQLRRVRQVLDENRDI